MIAAFVQAARLCAALTGGDVPMAVACPAALAIVMVADEHDPALVAAIAWGESRFRPDVISPDGRDCGVMGVRSRPSLCAVIRRDAWTGYRHGIRRLRESRAFCAHRGERGDLCMMAGYASGPAGVRGRWYRGPRSVLRRAARIRRAMEFTAGRRAEEQCP